MKLRKLLSIHFAFQIATTNRERPVLTRHIPTAIFCSLLGRKTILEIHSPPESFSSKLMVRLLLRLHCFIGLILISKALEAEFFRQYGKIGKNKAHVLADSAFARIVQPGDSINFRAAHSLDNCFTVGYSGSFLPGKGVEVVVKLAELFPSVQFLVIGGSEEEIARVRPESSSRNIIFTGTIPTIHVAVGISCCDVVLLPNKRVVLVNNGREDIGKWTSPLKMFEYMAARRPIICSRLEVLSEVLAEGVDCLMADPDDISEWTFALKKLINSPEIRQDLADAAYSKFFRNYTWEKRALKIVQIFNQ